MGLSAKQLQDLFTRLSSSPSSSRFTVWLCKLCLAGTPAAGGRRARPKPQARAAPRPTPRERKADADNAKAAESQPTASSTNTEPETMRRTLSVPPTSEVLGLLAGPSTSKTLSTDATYQLKFQLVSAYCELQNQLDPSEQDPTWRSAQESGELGKAVDAAFAGAEDAEDAALAQCLKETIAAAGWCQ